MKRSSAERSTRMRERAQQSWPALPKTASGAEAAAFSRSASANTTLADLPPSSSVTRLIVLAAASAIPRPTSVEPVNATFATSGCSTSRCPQTRPGPATTFTTPSGSPASSAIFSSSSAVSGVSSAGFSTMRVAGGQRRRHLPGGDRQREVPGHDQPDHAERLAEGHVHAAGHRDRVAQQPLRRGGVVAEGVDHHPHLAARVGDRLAGVARLEHRKVPGPLLERVGQPVQEARAVGRRHGPPGRGRPPWRGRPRRRSPRRPPARARPAPPPWRAR